MRLILYILIALFVAFGANAQGKRARHQKKNKKAQQSEIVALSSEDASFDPTLVEIEPDQYPELRGGPTDFLEYVAHNIRYPESAKKDGVEGKVMVTATINADGHVREAEILQGLRPDIDQEALRLVREMPYWRPAQKNGRAVASKAVVMVPFVINKDPEPFK